MESSFIGQIKNARPDQLQRLFFIMLFFPALPFFFSMLELLYFPGSGFRKFTEFHGIGPVIVMDKSAVQMQ